MGFCCIFLFWGVNLFLITLPSSFCMCYPLVWPQCPLRGESCAVGLWGLVDSTLSCCRWLSWRGGLSPLLSWKAEETAPKSGQSRPYQHLSVPSAPILLQHWMSVVPGEAAEEEAQALTMLPRAQLRSLEIFLLFAEAYP